MKKIVSILAVIAFMATACTKDKLTEPQPEQTGRTFTLTASAPAGGDNGNPKTRTAIYFGVETRDIIVKWKQGDKINLYFKQGNLIKEQRNVALYDFTDGNKKAKFNVTVPESINITQPYTLYGVHGATSALINNEAIASCELKLGKFDTFDIPMWFKTEVSLGAVATVAFRHLGALAITHLANTGTTPLKIDFAPVPIDVNGNAIGLYEKIALPSGVNASPIFNLITGMVVGGVPLSEQPEVTTTIEPQGTADFALWGIPNGIPVPESTLMIDTYDASGGFVGAYSTNTKPARGTLQTGRAYHINAEWNGTELRFVDENNRPKMAIEYVAEYNVSATAGVFATSHDNDKSGYFTWNEATTTTLPAGYHLPDENEWIGIFPRDAAVNFENAFSFNNITEVITVKGETKTYRADYRNTGTGISYALRFKPSTSGTNPATDKSMLAAYRYERVGMMDTENNLTDHLKVTARYLGNNAAETAEVIAQEAFWTSNKEKDATRIFPACGSILLDNTTLMGRGQKGYYWSSTEFTNNNADAWGICFFSASVSAHGYNGSKLFRNTVRPFSNN